MKRSNSKTNVFAFLGVAFVLLIALMFTGCPNAAGSNTPFAPVGSYNAVTGKGVVGGVEFTMKKIEAVTAKSIGHNDESDNKPHKVSLSAYLIGETEVTQELWTAVIGTNPSNFTDSLKNPVEMVSWYDCVVFCNELTKKVPELGESQCVYTVEGHIYGTADATADKVPAMDMSKKGFRLPTEAEWEWAAMGGKDYKWPGTNTKSELVNYAWYDANSSNKTHEVKKKTANAYGLYDMSGNVWEWCWDRRGSSTPAGGQDPTGAGSGSYRVGRGGSWKNNASNAAWASRGNLEPDRIGNYLGLRVACRP